MAGPFDREEVTLSMQTYLPQKSFHEHRDNVVHAWYLVDAEKERLGRMAVGVATLLMGKHKPTYTPYLDCGDFVVVTNAAKVGVTGNKREQKLYRHHTGYLGGLRSHTLAWMLEHKPEQVVREAVKCMLPKGRLGRKLIKKLKVYPGTEHKHGAQNPKETSFTRSR